MALSNIRKEPQREITESLVGITIVAGALLLDYLGCRWINFMLFQKDPCPIALAMFLLPLTLFLAGALSILLMFGTHGLGEIVCGALARRGLELRPKNRE